MRARRLVTGADDGLRLEGAGGTSARRREGTWGAVLEARMGRTDPWNGRSRAVFRGNPPRVRPRGERCTLRLPVTSLCRALLVLDIAYCALAAAQEGLPGWHMFEDVERFDVALRDRDGAPIDVRAYLPRGAWLVRYDELREVVHFVCEKERARAPLTFEERVRGVKVTLGSDCRVPRVRR